ncbi:hypothetical protein MCOR07_008712 [Pyricularia oryzae]|nr:hypothetical protein MCOR01_002896 [Pyricularia oryzae]KAI6259080.1 hypothetical protein MCOR19_004556 [Pyricularia oryzae]KAI6276493.1 hypothetical protein MCOR26_005583 [Pyricularia oryzae]KAI6334345.1 hypothetical protein MCOR29_000660 [Pyricularia oryzae]KAI6342422.1 hypothetical protein MCOR28_005395 [Pyricularia oryzae]
MRLLNVRTGDTTPFPSSSRPPPYAALSHLHGPEEISFQQWATLPRATLKARAAYFKIKRARVQAISDGLEWVFVDSVCVDGSSPAEASEAVNEAWAVFAGAATCYAHLDDIAQPVLGASLESALRTSRWFGRGWTLMELVASRDVVFYSTRWEVLGTRRGLAGVISTLTGIDEAVLAGKDEVGTVSVSRKMSWAAGRRTTRAEDAAYCLLGLFGVNMPLMYGEGRTCAFRRLQEEILRAHPLDHTLFAWGERIVRERVDRLPQEALLDGTETLKWRDDRQLLPLLADSPDQFAGSADLVPMTVAAEMFHYGNDVDASSEGKANTDAVLPSVSGRGVLIETPTTDPYAVLYPWRGHRISQLRWGKLAVLFCHRRDDPYEQFAVALTPTGPASYARAPELLVGNFTQHIWQRTSSIRMLVRPDPGVPSLAHGDLVLRRWVVGNNEELLSGAFPCVPSHHFSSNEGILRVNGSASGKLLWSMSALSETETLATFITRRPSTGPTALGSTAITFYPLSSQIASETCDADGTIWLPHPGSESGTLALAEEATIDKAVCTHVFKTPSDTWISPGVGNMLPLITVRVDRIWIVEGRVAIDVVDVVAPYPVGSPFKGTLPRETFTAISQLAVPGF